jgi:hypothetical protein
MEDSDKVLLNNGAEETYLTVRVMSLRLELLKKSNFPAFKELFEKCKDTEHEIPLAIWKSLQWVNLLENDGSVRESIKNIMLSATQEKEWGILELIDPIKKVAVEEIKDTLEETTNYVEDTAEVPQVLPLDSSKEDEDVLPDDKTIADEWKIIN